MLFSLQSYPSRFGISSTTLSFQPILYLQPQSLNIIICVCHCHSSLLLFIIVVVHHHSVHHSLLFVIIIICLVVCHSHSSLWQLIHPLFNLSYCASTSYVYPALPPWTSQSFSCLNLFFNFLYLGVCKINMQPFIDMENCVRPHAIAWMIRDENAFQLLRATPMLLESARVGSA